MASRHIREPWLPRTQWRRSALTRPFKLRPEMLEQLLAPKKSETEILVVHPTPASSTAPTARA